MKFEQPPFRQAETSVEQIDQVLVAAVEEYKDRYADWLEEVITSLGFLGNMQNYFRTWFEEEFSDRVLFDYPLAYSNTIQQGNNQSTESLKSHTRKIADFTERFRDAIEGDAIITHFALHCSAPSDVTPQVQRARALLPKEPKLDISFPED